MAKKSTHKNAVKEKAVTALTYDEDSPKNVQMAEETVS